MINPDDEELLYLQEQDQQRGQGMLRRRRTGMEGHVVKRGRSSWHGTALIMEAVMLLLFVTISLGVVVSLLAYSHSLGETANQGAYAAALASTGARNGAEAFSADPTGMEETTYYQVEEASFTETSEYLSGAYVVNCQVEPEKRKGGVLYRATITVSRYNAPVYTLRTAKYVSERGPGHGV
ncbi:MAG: hypothetical protein Q4D06_05290 [Coriobacteriia bacterium]|nr:hypothetical protein [Coriobacteriia bacterium]